MCGLSRKRSSRRGNKHRTASAVHIGREYCTCTQRLSYSMQPCRVAQHTSKQKSHRKSQLIPPFHSPTYREKSRREKSMFLPLLSSYQTRTNKRSSIGKELCGPSDAVFKQRTSDPRTGSKNAWPALMVP